MTKEQQITAVKRYTFHKLGEDKSGHGMDHINRVVKMAKKIAESEGIDTFLPVVAAYLHDTIDEKLVADVDQAKEELRNYLSENEFNDDDIATIMDVIANISFAHTLDDQKIHLSIVGKIVRDADWLDALGAIGTIRAIYYGGAHHQKIYDPRMAPRTNMSHDEYRNLDNETIINHFYEKILTLADMMQTATGQKIAAHRQEVIKNFLKEFHDEWNAEM
ncbi:MAG: HD domain-containing protein [Limosilactobacillus sp.]|uniref:HD domain-containing protein n=1 Tax=Limosilactobacillus sp. TaxID=2773925 RepID=UPI002706975D|nr:HD domain-containing protein [Limosilactobacillus sp.]